MMLVIGHCPMGCGRTLGIGSAHLIVCTADTCPRPTAAHELLANAETEHIVELLDDTFNIRHPLRERLGDAILTCPLAAWIAHRDESPEPTGRYRATIAELKPLQIHLERIGDVA